MKINVVAPSHTIIPLPDDTHVDEENTRQSEQATAKDVGSDDAPGSPEKKRARANTDRTAQPHPEVGKKSFGPTWTNRSIACAEVPGNGSKKRHRQDTNARAGRHAMPKEEQYREHSDENKKSQGIHGFQQASRGESQHFP